MQIAELARNIEWSRANLSTLEYDVLREHTTNPSVWQSDANRQILNRVLSNIPETAETLTLYSGAELPINDYKFSASLSLPYFTSSYKRDIAVKYAKMLRTPCLFVLTIPVGSKVVCLDEISAHGAEEGEVLLSGDAELRIRQIEICEILTIYADYVE